MEGLVTTEPAETERVPQSPTLVECADIFADKQIVTQLVGGGPRLTGKAKTNAKSDVEPRLPDTEHRKISSNGSTRAILGDAMVAPSQLEPSAASADEARREKARRKKKLKKERDRAAAAAAAAAAASSAAEAEEEAEPKPESAVAAATATATTAIAAPAGSHAAGDAEQHAPDGSSDGWLKIGASDGVD